MDPRGFFDRLRKRKLVQWTAAYVAGAAALFGTLETIGQVFAWPDGVLRAVFFLLLAGLLATVVLAWFHGEEGRQGMTPVEVLLLGAAGVLGVMGAGYSLVTLGAGVDPEASSASSLVVVPFTDASPDRDQQYLGEGVAEEIRRALSERQGRPVPRGRASDAGGGTAHVLEGSVQRVAEQVRVAARLTDRTGAEIWSHRYEVPAGELLEVENRIADAVAGRLGLDGGSEAARPVARDSPPDPTAHDHYLRGEYALKQRTPASVIEAISEYRAASALAPELTSAVAREAYGYGLFLDWGWTYPGLSKAELLRRGLELAGKALEQDSLSSEGWLARAYLLQLGDPRDLAAAAEAFGRAVSLDPTNPEAHHQYGQTLMALGRYAEAKASYHAALAIEPDRAMTLVPLSAIALREGDLRGAERWADSAVALARDAPYPWASRAQFRLGLGQAVEARADAERALQIDPSYELPSRSALAAALTALGSDSLGREELTRARRAMVHPESPSPTEAYYLATALIRMGDRREALDVIEAAEPRSGWLWFYLQSPAFDAVRDDERFRRVIEGADP